MTKLWSNHEPFGRRGVLQADPAERVHPLRRREGHRRGHRCRRRATRLDPVQRWAATSHGRGPAPRPRSHPPPRGTIVTITAELFPRCALPGCAIPTDTQGHPCRQCRRDLGTLVRHNPGGRRRPNRPRPRRRPGLPGLRTATHRRRRRTTHRPPDRSAREARTVQLAVRETPKV
ncbi:Uncharacterised protein [Clostridioides difficile]|nr:Uncharacterised protein [Clostridioides difficile]